MNDPKERREDTGIRADMATKATNSAPDPEQLAAGARRERRLW